MKVRIKRTPHRFLEKFNCSDACGKEFEEYKKDGYKGKVKLCTVPGGLPAFLDTVDFNYPEDYLVEPKD